MPTITECAEYWEPRPKGWALHGQCQRLYSLDSRVSATENDSSLIDLVAGVKSDGGFPVGGEADFIDQMLAALEPWIASWWSDFALDGGEHQTLSALGKVVGLSRERTRQGLNRAIRQIGF